MRIRCHMHMIASNSNCKPVARWQVNTAIDASYPCVRRVKKSSKAGDDVLQQIEDRIEV